MSDNFGANPAYIKWDVVRGDTSVLRVEFYNNDENSPYDTSTWTYVCTVHNPKTNEFFTLDVTNGDGFATITATPEVSAQWGSGMNDLVAQLDVLGVENEWVQESTKKLREYADRRETERFSKEAFYKSDRMRTRMGVRDESACYIPEAEAMEVPSFLRRKVEFGKRSQSNRRDP